MTDKASAVAKDPSTRKAAMVDAVSVAYAHHVQAAEKTRDLRAKLKDAISNEARAVIELRDARIALAKCAEGKP